MARQDKEARDGDSRTPPIHSETRGASHLDVPAARDAKARMTKGADSPHSTDTPRETDAPESGRGESPAHPATPHSERPLTGHSRGSPATLGIGGIDRDQPSTGATDAGLMDAGRTPDDEGEP
jgi:hypothetical protein